MRRHLDFVTVAATLGLGGLSVVALWATTPRGDTPRWLLFETVSWAVVTAGAIIEWRRTP